MTPPASRPHPANSAPLVGLPVLALDLETTGLDVTRDRIVQIGAVAMRGAHLLEAPRINQKINPGVPVPERASRIHGLTDGDLVGAPRFVEFLPSLREALSGRVVVGHNIGFDLAVLRHETARAGVAWQEPPALDVGILTGALEPSLPDLGLETVASMLGVTLEKRHDALGDSLTAAHVFARLLARLREADVRTLGEARALAVRRGDVALKQAHAGWDAQPGGIAAASVPLSQSRVDGYIFQKQVGDVMSSPPVRIAPESTLREAARLMVSRRIGALLVGAEGAPARGIITERDVMRETAVRGVAADNEPVTGAMSSPVETVQCDEMLYRALGRMTRRGVRHLCVTDAHGAEIGMISQRDLLKHRAMGADAVGDELAVAADGAALAAAYAHVPQVAAGLVAEGVSGEEVARVVSGEIRALVARSAELAVAELESEGRPAPAAWCLAVLGSAGRGESMLSADQDHALIHNGGAQDDAWYEELGRRVAEKLDVAGLPLCKGGVMSSQATWRGTVGQWRERIENWLQRARPEDLLNVDILFDLAPAAGSAAIAYTLHEAAVLAASRTRPFLALLAQSVASLPPILGLFGAPAVSNGRIDLKRNALLPITGMARTLALRIGSTARATPDRLREAAAAGRIGEGDAQALIRIHAEVVGWILRQQLLDIESGVRPSSRVAMKSLRRHEAKHLRAYLRKVDEILGGLSEAIAG